MAPDARGMPFGLEHDKGLGVRTHRAAYDAARDRAGGCRHAILADGFSCREQIRQMSDRQPLHVAQLVGMALAGDAHAARGGRD